QHLSEDAAYKRIQAARAARKFPAIFDAVAEGRLHLSAACMLAPYLTPENADGLLKAATYKTKAEIEALLAARFPRSETLALAQAIPPERPPGDEQLAPGQVAERVEAQADPPAAPQVEQLAPRPKVAPVAPERFLLQLTIGRSTHDKLRYAQALLSHQAPSGDVAEVLDRALDALIAKLEKTKFAATDKPRASRRLVSGPLQPLGSPTREGPGTAHPCARSRSSNGAGPVDRPDRPEADARPRRAAALPPRVDRSGPARRSSAGRWLRSRLVALRAA